MFLKRLANSFHFRQFRTSAMVFSHSSEFSRRWFRPQQVITKLKCIHEIPRLKYFIYHITETCYIIKEIVSPNHLSHKNLRNL